MNSSGGTPPVSHCTLKLDKKERNRQTKKKEERKKELSDLFSVPPLCVGAPLWEITLNVTTLSDPVCQSAISILAVLCSMVDGLLWVYGHGPGSPPSRSQDDGRWKMPAQKSVGPCPFLEQLSSCSLLVSWVRCHVRFALRDDTVFQAAMLPSFLCGGWVFMLMV